MNMRSDQYVINVNTQIPDDKAGTEKDHKRVLWKRSGPLTVQENTPNRDKEYPTFVGGKKKVLLMFYTDRGIGPDVRTGEERVPRLDPLRTSAKGGSDALAGVVEFAGVGLRARLWVGGSQRGDANVEWRSGPNIRAGDVAIELLDLTRGKSKLGLDGRACFTSSVTIGLVCASRATLRSVVRPVRYADRSARPDVIASQERIPRLDGTANEIKIVFNGSASVVGLGDVGRLAGWGWSRSRGRGWACGRACGWARGWACGGARGGARSATRLIRTVGDADGSINPDIIAGEEGVSSVNGSRVKVELVLNRGASITGLGGISRLAGRRLWGLGRPRATTEPGAIACAVTTDGVICGKIGALSNCQEREAPVGKGVDGSVVECSISGRLEGLVRECEMGAGVGLIESEIEVEVNRILFSSSLRITRIEVPKDNRLSVLLLNVVGDLLVDTTVRRTKKLWPDTKDLYKRLVKALNFVVDLIMAERLEVGMTPGVRGNLHSMLECITKALDIGIIVNA